MFILASRYYAKIAERGCEWEVCQDKIAKILAAFLYFSVITLYAILTGVAVLFGINIWHYNLFCEGPYLAGTSSIFHLWPETTPPQAFSRHRMNYAWNDLQVTHFTNTSIYFFFSLLVPNLLFFCLLRQRTQYIKESEPHFVQQLFLNQELIALQQIRNEHMKRLKAIRASLKCTLCPHGSKPKIFTRPHTLLPCGHTFDLHCLQRFFRSPPSQPNSSDPADLLHRQKFCPLCTTEVTEPPVPVWLVKNLVDAVDGPKAAAAAARTPVDRNPWEGIFTPRVRLPVQNPDPAVVLDVNDVD
ncbi:hypothetical protein B0H19DRAFT_1076201 [Mycena capillaripes]|nr:hypothetical protein B0H19DRAFT_1076201 [Mycena capillaripes]